MNPAATVIAEIRALNAAVAAAKGDEEARGQACVLTRESLAARRPLASGDAIETTIEEAMRFVCGFPPLGMAIYNDHAAAPVCQAWLASMRGDSRKARRLLRGALAPKALDAEIEATALRLWTEAVERLVDGEDVEARRLWQRAMDFSANFGTETSNLIAWTFAASFRRG